MKNIPQDILDYVAKTFGKAPPLKNFKPCLIKFNGEYVRVGSGKSVWKCRGHAKNALNNHFQYADKAILNKVGAKDAKEFVKFLENAGIIEFVEFENSMYGKA